MSAAELIDIDFERLLEVIPGIVTGEVPAIPLAPAFPHGILPPAFEQYVHAAARSIGVPPEMVAVPLLVIAGATIGNRLHITLKRGYTQYAALFAAVIADPGSAKTPATLAAQWPISQLQREAVETYRRQMSEYEDEFDTWATKPKAERGAKPTKPELEHLYSSDLTVEALVSILSTSQGVAILRDEILSWVTSLDQYRGGKGSDRQQYLSLWSHAPIKSDRTGRETIYVANPVAGIYGGIQPDAVPSLHDAHGKRDGWIERMLLFFPDVQPPAWTDDDLDPSLALPLVDAFRTMRRIGSADPSQSLAVHLSTDAKALWSEWFNDNARDTMAASGLRRGFYSKMPNQVARLALVLNTLWNLDDPQRFVSEQRMVDALKLGEFFRDHLGRILPLIGDARTESTGLPGRILRILRKEGKKKVGGWVSRSVILNGLRNVQAGQLTDVLMQMKEEGRVERRLTSTATKPLEEWCILTNDQFGLSDNSEYSTGGAA